MNFRDVELLSEYLDGRLSESDTARLEARLSTDINLKATLEDLRQTRTLLRKLPQRRAPRNFRLTPQMAGIKPPVPRAYPAFRFATAMVALLFLAAVALNAFTPFAARQLAAAPAPMTGLGGGGGGYGGGPIGGGDGTLEPPAAPATEAPLQSLAAPAPTATPEASLAQATVAPEAQDTARAQAESTEMANKSAPAEPPAQSAAGTGPALPQSPPLPIPIAWIVALGVLMILLGAVAWLLRASNERRVRSRWNHR